MNQKGYFAVEMIDKAVRRILSNLPFFDREENVPSSRVNQVIDVQRNLAVSAPDLASSVNKELLKIRELGHEVMWAFDPQYGYRYDLGALYIACLLIKPKTVFQVGVEAGLATNSILCALAKLDDGHLYSIDPRHHQNFRNQPETGAAVFVDLKCRWTSFIGPSERSFDFELISREPPIEVLHFGDGLPTALQEKYLDGLEPFLADHLIVFFDGVVEHDLFEEFAQRRGMGFMLGTTSEFRLGIVYKHPKFEEVLLRTSNQMIEARRR